MRYAGTRNPRAETNPLRSIPLFKPLAQVFRPTSRQHAEAKLFIARRDLPRAEMFVQTACAALGQANRMRSAMRRVWQAKAMRQINQARAELRAARKALVAAEAGMLALDADLFQGAA